MAAHGQEAYVLTECVPGQDGVAFRRFMEKNVMLSRFNIFFGSHARVVEYWDWAFPILLRIDEASTALAADVGIDRIAGFVSERLFSFWLSVSVAPNAVVQAPIVSLAHATVTNTATGEFEAGGNKGRWRPNWAYRLSSRGMGVSEASPWWS